MKRTSKTTLLLVAICAIIVVQLLSANSAGGEPRTTQGIPQQELDAYIEKAAKTLGLPGLSVAISRDGQLLYSKNHGRGITPDTMFFIGSISKSFTGLAIMQLVEKGVVDLDASVSSYLPAFTVSDEIKVRHLLHHTSGMSEHEYVSKLPPHASFEDMIADMNGMTLRHAPGVQFEYFNPNYNLLGAIVAAVSGKSYEAYMEEHVLAPLGLNHTSVRGKVDVPGHLSIFGLPVRRAETFKLADLPSGYITSSTQDLILYLDALHSHDSALGISPGGVEMLLDAQPYGMGWMRGTFAGRPATHHGGNLPGFISNAIMLTEDGHNVVILSNQSHLFNAFIYFPDLSKGIVAVLTNQTPPQRFHYIWIFRLMLIPFVWNLFASIRSLIRLARSTEQRPLSWRLRAVVMNLAIPLTLFLLIPIGARALLNRGMTWSLAFLLIPEIAWMFIGMAFHLLDAAAHLTLAFKERAIKQHH